jgi:hypothetical protein
VLKAGCGIAIAGHYGAGRLPRRIAIGRVLD